MANVAAPESDLPCLLVGLAIRLDPVTAAPYLARLNPEQRRAAEHGDPSPLRIIAGAGTGKTNTRI
jgi:hypothetical protein